MTGSYAARPGITMSACLSYCYNEQLHFRCGEGSRRLQVDHLEERFLPEHVTGVCCRYGGHPLTFVSHFNEPLPEEQQLAQHDCNVPTMNPSPLFYLFHSIRRK